MNAQPSSASRNRRSTSALASRSRRKIRTSAISRSMSCKAVRRFTASISARSSRSSSSARRSSGDRSSTLVLRMRTGGSDGCLRRLSSGTSQAYRDDRAHVFHSWSAQRALAPVVVAGGEGSWFRDEDGRRYLDFSSQLVNLNLGHQHPALVAAI